MFDRLLEHVRDAEFDLRDHVLPRVPERACVVKTEPKPVRPKLQLADYVSAEAEPPAAVHRSNLGNIRLGDILGNGEWGDCGEGMALHGIEAFHLDAGTQVPPFVTQDALDLYSAVSGWDPSKGPPGQNPTDTGTDNQRLVDHWRDVGITCRADGSVHKIAGSLFVDPKDTRVSRIAIWEFVVLFRAAGLPKNVQGQANWKLTDPSLQGDAAVGSWGYHDYPYFSYDQRRLRDDTWGEPGLVDWAWDTAYGVEGFVVVTQEMLNLSGLSPAGIDWTRLNQDLKSFPPAPPN